MSRLARELRFNSRSLKAAYFPVVFAGDEFVLQGPFLDVGPASAPLMHCVSRADGIFHPLYLPGDKVMKCFLLCSKVGGELPELTLSKPDCRW